jgi:X-linked retinitis pigmentosa GTPase regulator
VFYWGSNQHSLLSPASHKSYNKPQQVTLSHDLLDISASEKHVSFISSDGTLWSYGLNLDGRLGVGGKPDLKYHMHSPCKVKLPTRATKVKCGFSHACVQLANDELYAWGLGDYGSLGTGEFKSKATPTKVLLKGKITNFSCGAMHSGFVDSEGSIFTCGSNEYGELGVNRPEKIATPILINFNHKVKQIECGVFYTLLLTTKGQVYGMGNNKYGQLGIGHKVNECHPTYIRELDNIVCIAAGYHSGAVDADGNLYIWGSGSFGELLKPKKIVMPSPINQVFIRGFFGVAVSNKNIHKVYTWGNNTYGELGRGNFESAKDPLEVAELSNIKFDTFACGVNFFLAVTKDGSSAQIEGGYRTRYDYLAGERNER